MPPALIGKMADLIFPHVTADELELRRKSAESQPLFTPLATEDKTDDDILLNRPVP